MDAFICVTCGTQFPPSAEPLPGCSICLDERQYVGHDGQLWTTMAELARDHRNVVDEVESGLLGIGTEPSFAIGQRALLVDGLLWDCITLLDDETADGVARQRYPHDRDLPPALLLGDGRVGRALRCSRPPARGRSRMGRPPV